jgi:hypothetical protein
MTQSSASPEQQADDSSDDNVDDNLAPPAPSLTGSRCRSRAGQRTCALLGVKGSQVRILSSRRLGQGPLNRHIPGSACFCVFLLILWGGRRSWVSRFSACHGRNLGALRFRSRNGVGVWVRVSSLSRCAGCDVFGVAAAGLMRSCRVAGWYRRGCPAWGHVGS